MLTDFLRDHAFAIGLFGVMTMVWLGWGQEDPPKSWRWRLGVGAGLGVLVAVPFIIGVVAQWRTPSALDHGYGVFIAVFAVEVALIVAASIVLALRRSLPWISWWIGLVVALHFIPLAFVFGDASYAILGLVQTILLLVVAQRIRRSEHPASRLVGPIMGGSFLVFAIVSAVIFLVRHGLPWAA